MPLADDLPWQLTASGLTLTVRLTPRAQTARIDGIGTDTLNRPVLLLRVAAPPVQGAANAAVIAFLAKTLALPKGALTVLSGDTSRVKRLGIVGDGPKIAGHLARLCAPLCASASPSAAPNP